MKYFAQFIFRPNSDGFNEIEHVPLIDDASFIGNVQLATEYAKELLHEQDEPCCIQMTVAGIFASELKTFQRTVSLDGNPIHRIHAGQQITLPPLATLGIGLGDFEPIAQR